MVKRDGPYSASFLWEQPGAWNLSTPEELNDEQKELAKLARSFLTNEVEPVREKIESKEYPKLVPSLLKKAGELGLLMAEVPEAYGGVGVKKNTAKAIAEKATGWTPFIVPPM